MAARDILLQKIEAAMQSSNLDVTALTERVNDNLSHRRGAIMATTRAKYMNWEQDKEIPTYSQLSAFSTLMIDNRQNLPLRDKEKLKKQLFDPKAEVHPRSKYKALSRGRQMHMLRNAMKYTPQKVVFEMHGLVPADVTGNEMDEIIRGKIAPSKTVIEALGTVFGETASPTAAQDYEKAAAEYTKEYDILMRMQAFPNSNNLGLATRFIAVATQEIKKPVDMYLRETFRDDYLERKKFKMLVRANTKADYSMDQLSIATRFFEALTPTTMDRETFTAITHDIKTALIKAERDPKEVEERFTKPMQQLEEAVWEFDKFYHGGGWNKGHAK